MSRVIPGVWAYTTGFIENKLSERVRFKEEDSEVGLRLVELEVALKYHHENIQQTMTCMLLELRHK